MTKIDFKKLPSLDGWRAISIVLVLFDHCKFTDGFPIQLVPIIQTTTPGGFGVRCFFVISGFLITWLLIKEYEKNGNISLKKFFIRRALRIFPVCFVFLGVLFFLTPYHQNTSAWLANLSYTTDFFGSPLTTFHLWSLGVEEQFYILWPFLLLLCFVRGCPLNWYKAFAILAIPLIVAPGVRLCICKGWFPAQMAWLFNYYSFFAKFDSLAFGCIAAILFSYFRHQVELFYLRYAGLASCGGGLLIVLPVPLHLIHFPGRLQAAMFDTMQAFGFALLLLQSVLHPRLGCYRALNWIWVRHIGVMSYSIYIWQQMFCGTDETVFNVKGAWWVSFPVWILVTLVVAHASYYLIEKPLFKLRARFRD